MRERLAIKLTGSSEELGRCRSLIRQESERMGFAGRKRDEIVSAVFEACANALIHGRRTSDEAVTLTIRECDDCLEAIVNDRGKGFSGSNGSSLPRPTADRGRGIPLMRAFMDEVYYDFSEGCTVVLRKILPKD